MLMAEPVWKVTALLKVRMPGLLPGLSEPAMVVTPPMVPEPPRVAPKATVSEPVPVPEPVVLLTNKVPVETTVPPV